MDLTARWPVLGELCARAAHIRGLELWAFGSMLRSERPDDLDVLVIYRDRADVVALRDAGWWEVRLPPLDIIAMTPDEEAHYRFVEVTGARSLPLPPSPRR